MRDKVFSKKEFIASVTENVKTMYRKTLKEATQQEICLAIMDVLYNETGDSKYRACPLIRKMVRGGNLGVKTGKGFYVYNADRTKTPVDAQ